MGCDIHMVVERRKKNGHWVATRILDGILTDMSGKNAFYLARSRNYERFAALAGVRGDGPAAVGLPDDASATAKLLSEGSDYHSHSWLPLKEAAAVFLATEHRSDLSDFAKQYPMEHYFNVYADETPEPHRLVFWFDN